MLGKCSRQLAYSDNGVLKVLAGATVEVRREDNDAVANIFQDVNGTILQQNPFTADANGQFTIYAEGVAGGYRITATKDAHVAVERHVPIGSVQYLDESDIAIPEMSEFGQALVNADDETEAQALLELEPGVNVQAYDAALDTLSGTSPTAAGLALLEAANAAAQRSALELAGWHDIPIPAIAMKPRESNGCAPIEVIAGSANQPDIPYLAFDGATKEYATAHIPAMPRSWDKGAIRIACVWRRASGTDAANVVWAGRARVINDNESPAQNFGTEGTVTDAASTTTVNFMTSGQTGDITPGGTPSDGCQLAIEVYRKGDDSGDTLNSVDAYLAGIVVYVKLTDSRDASA